MASRYGGNRLNHRCRYWANPLFPVTLIDSKHQYFVWIAGAVLIIFGIWYGVTQQEEAEIFSPSLIAYVGGGALLTSFATYVRKRSH